MKRVLIGLCLVLCVVVVPCWAANDPSGDPNCVGWWTFDDYWDGGDANDTSPVGTNHLEDGMTGQTRDTTYYKEGVASCNHIDYPSSYLYRQDSDLSAKFPGKQAQGNTTWSFVAWVYWDTTFLSSGEELDVAGKWYSGKYAYKCYIYNNSGTHEARLDIGYNSGSSAENVIAYSGLSFSADQWYHVAFTYDGPTKAAHIRVWDDDAETVYDTTDTSTNSINDTDSERFTVVGVTQEQGDEGIVDEVGAFNDILTSEEIDQIREGEYAPSSGGTPQFIGHILAQAAPWEWMRRAATWRDPDARGQRVLAALGDFERMRRHRAGRERPEGAAIVAECSKQ